MPDQTDRVLIQRFDQVRRIGPFRRSPRRYRLGHPDGSETVLSLAALDSILEARRTPADFWACVDAADTAYAAGDTVTRVEWPSSRPVRD